MRVQTEANHGRQRHNLCLRCSDASFQHEAAEVLAQYELSGLCARVAPARLALNPLKPEESCHGRLNLTLLHGRSMDGSGA